MSAALRIAPDAYVTIRYSIFEDGEAVATQGAEDLSESYVHGYGQVFPALERGLEGRVSGTHVSVLANPEDAFGLHEEDGIFEVDKEGLDGSETLVAGEEFMASGPEGEILMRVIEVRADTLLVDTNHPLAGKRVRFEVDVVEVRAATEDEIGEAQEELDDASQCGCGHDHEGHEHPKENGLVQLGSSRRKIEN